MSGPISPTEAASGKHIPDEVFDAFNELIQEGSGVVRQKDVVARILAKMPAVDSNTVYQRGWLNVEGAYRAKGWRVEYDKPGWDESYEAFFTFRKAGPSGPAAPTK